MSTSYPSYPSNLSDAEWECLQRYLPPQSRRGRPPTHSLRAIFNAIFYVLRTGCPWRYLPTNFPPSCLRPISFGFAARWLEGQEQPIENVLHVRKLGIKRQVRVIQDRGRQVVKVKRAERLCRLDGSPHGECPTAL